MNILYIGGFILPDKNAAAQRVLNNAKALRDLGHTVYFVNETKTETPEGWTEYCGFACYERRRPNQFVYLTSVGRLKRIIRDKKISTVIAYNYPSAALNSLAAWCRRNHVKCYADATEWYVAQGNPIFRIIKNLDSNFRMKKVHFRLDGVIAISRYLYEYYRNGVDTVQIPPLSDLEDPKWQLPDREQSDTVRFVYAGSPDSQKERLDLLVDAAEQIAPRTNVTLDIVGIDLAQYESIYGCKYLGNAVKFHGRVSHSEALDFVKKADWSIVIRDNNLVVKAGFPTKVTESISAGTPVIANRFSNIEDYLNSSNSILIDDISELSEAMLHAVSKKADVDRTVFDYRNYLRRLQYFLCE